MSQNTNGHWNLDKRPAVYEFDVRLGCGVCYLGERLTFEARPTEGSSFADGRYPGTWRKLNIHGDHDDPLRQPLVVCSRECATKATTDYIDKLYA